ncbi:loganic acid O-methyltransferase-like [Juglans microcarpa x Juglans regia]|uniref:loganic acid O-methyltransferase-like n=1 Tax=Juglans microcarpa x Juglans regia TaxID=2249226 RepID=UPI001B7E4AFC|nr:loganic acid O-methyltransferase-like [Juglans microcarpa x Juglans regia]
MTGGNGRYSYAKNSSPQRAGADRAKSLIIEAIAENIDIDHEDVSSPISNIFGIADLGCSVGPNTYVSMKNIIEAVVQKYKSKGRNLPEFQVFFNDHVSNDFNTLFADLPADRQYFGAGVPGSFYHRLFPKASLKFVYSAYAIHWLSRAPPEVGDLDSATCNKGRLYYRNATKEVGQAYSAQFEKDMESFLSARADELAPGGLMAILMSGRKDETLPIQSSLGPQYQAMESSLLDLVNEGIISKDKMDSFNLPIYGPSAEEIKAIVVKNGHFDIVRLVTRTSNSSLMITVKECRAGFDGIFSKHFGSENMDQLFDRFSKKVAEMPPLSGDDLIRFSLNIILKRKP